MALSLLQLQVARSWDLWVLKQAPADRLVDYSHDLWNDAALDEVEDWLTAHLQRRASSRRVRLDDV